MIERITIGRIARLLGVERTELALLASRAEYLYRHRRKTTGRKKRIISEPEEELKSVQRELAAKVMSSLPMSLASFSVKGGGVVRAALEHLSHPHMLVLDLADCFPAMGLRLIRAGLQRAGLTEEAAGIVTRLVTVKGALPQGAPTSSVVLDIVLHDLDRELSALAVDYDSRYTRYADDLCFSGPHELSSIASRARLIIRRHGFRINERKTRLTGPQDAHVVTGISVSDELHPRPGYTRGLAAKLRRAKRAKHACNVDKLQGQVAWVMSLNRTEGRELHERHPWLWTQTRREE